VRQRNGIPGPRGSQLKRQIDHVVGTPLLLALGLLRRKRHLPTKIATVGILSCSAIGDTIIASAIARDLKAAFPGCRVVAFVGLSARGIVSLVEGFDQEVSLPITRPLEALHVLRSHPTDVLIDITPWPRMTALVSALARTSFTIGFRSDGQHRHFAYDAAVRHMRSRHEVENYWALLAPLGIIGRLRPRARAEFRARTQRSNTHDRTVVLHPWASGFRSTMREWPMSHWAGVARELIADGATAVITGGLSDRDRAEALSVMIDRPGRVIVLAGTASLRETASRVAAAGVVISVNTGIMHLAAAIDQNLVALHGPTNPLRWGPLSEKAVVIGLDRSQGGSYLNLGFEYPADTPNCMALIGINEVLAQARRHINAERLEDKFRSAGAHVLIGADVAPDDHCDNRLISTPTALSNRSVTADVDVAATGHSLPNHKPKRYPSLIKRAEDLVCAIILLITTLPAMLLIALAIKLESHGAAFFQQERYGYNGQRIRIYKFRSMYEHAEDPCCEQQTTRNDPRVTRVGAILRKHSLDELPQLLNVLAGEMSVVGPRPHAILTSVDGLLLEDIVTSYGLRHSMKPGITGLAQVNGWRGPLDTVEKVVKRLEYDLLYIKNWSILLDIKILVKTVTRVWNDNQAY